MAYSPPHWVRCLTWRNNSAESYLNDCATLALPGRSCSGRCCAGNMLNVMVIEDVHWADQATIDLLQFLAAGPEACR